MYRASVYCGKGIAEAIIRGCYFFDGYLNYKFVACNIEYIYFFQPYSETDVLQ